MKLYATVSSERATKGQGGNEYLNIDVKNEAEVVILSVRAFPSGLNNPDCGMIVITLPSGKTIRHEYEKGKQQKGGI